MKYWFLEKYKNIKVCDIPNLVEDFNILVKMPSDYQKRYELIKDINLEELDEEDLLIMLYVILNINFSKLNNVVKIIKKLLLIPNNSMPITDYNVKDILVDIKKLKNTYALKEKLDNNNIGACYNCMQVFYLDKIKYINKNNICLCPYCKTKYLYFDNDYMPMNYSFLKLANIYYSISNMGCSFKHLKQIIKKDISVQIGKINTIKDGLIIKEGNSSNMVANDINISISKFNIFRKKDSITSYQEELIYLNYYKALKCADKLSERIIYIDVLKVSNKYLNTYLLNLLISVIEILESSFYLKKVVFIVPNFEVLEKLNYILNEIKLFK